MNPQLVWKTSDREQQKREEEKEHKYEDEEEQDMYWHSLRAKISYETSSLST